MATVVTKDTPIKTTLTTQKVMMYLLIALVVLFAASLYHISLVDSKYVVRGLGLMVTSVVTSILVETVWFRFIKGIKTGKDIKKEISRSFPWITAMILTLSIPVWTSYYAVVIITIVAIVVGKLLYGGFGHNVFNPAAVGRAVFVFGLAVPTVAAVAGDMVTGGTITTSTGLTDPTMISSAMKGLNWTFVTELFIGHNIEGVKGGVKVGAMAETATLLMLVIGIVLAVKKVLDWRVLTTYLATFAVWVLISAMFFVEGATTDQAMMFTVAQLAIGGLMFGAVFMATDPVTMPQHPAGRVVYGLGLAFFTFLIRFSAGYPEGVLFAILIMNMLSPTVEKIFVGARQNDLQKQVVVVSSILVVMSGIVFLSVSAIWG